MVNSFVFLKRCEQKFIGDKDKCSSKRGNIHQNFPAKYTQSSINHQEFLLFFTSLQNGLSSFRQIDLTWPKMNTYRSLLMDKMDTFIHHITQKHSLTLNEIKDITEMFTRAYEQGRDIYDRNEDQALAFAQHVVRCHLQDDEEEDWTFIGGCAGGKKEGRRGG